MQSLMKPGNSQLLPLKQYQSSLMDNDSPTGPQGKPGYHKPARFIPTPPGPGGILDPGTPIKAIKVILYFGTILNFMALLNQVSYVVLGRDSVQPPKNSKIACQFSNYKHIQS